MDKKNENEMKRNRKINEKENAEGKYKKEHPSTGCKLKF